MTASMVVEMAKRIQDASAHAMQVVHVQATHTQLNPLRQHMHFYFSSRRQIPDDMRHSHVEYSSEVWMLNVLQLASAVNMVTVLNGSNS